MDARALHLSPEQQEIIDRLRHDFISAVGETGTTSNAPPSQPGSEANAGTNLPNPSGGDQQLQNWQSAQEQSDAIFKMQFGLQAFNLYEMALTPRKTP